MKNKELLNNFPKKIKIFGQDWKIVVAKLDENTSGETVYTDKCILICNSLNREQAERTLLHEILHASLCISGLGSTSSPLISHEIEEAIVTCLENALFPLYWRVK